MMTMHKLTAGDGYTYLTSQTAAGDVKREPGESLQDYYLAQGNPAGEWMGSGIADLGLSGEVTEAQMKALFGERVHPNAAAIADEMLQTGATAAEVDKAIKLGRAYNAPRTLHDEFDERIKSAFRMHERHHGAPPKAGAEADAVRRRVAAKYLSQKHGGVEPSPAKVREFLANRKALTRLPVAGYDLVFTPPKSFSVAWGLGTPEVSRKLEQIHNESVATAMRYLEEHATMYRVGNGGLRQERGRGLIAAAFQHADSRAGDPNLHTHMAVANVVLGHDNKWRSLDGRVLHSFAVAASETYTLEFQRRYSEAFPSVGLRDRFAQRKTQSVREIAGVDDETVNLFSKRRQGIVDRANELMRDYKERNGVEATASTRAKFYQQATLELRPAKVLHEGATQRDEWRDELASLAPVSHARLQRTLEQMETDLASAIAPAAGTLSEAHIDLVARDTIARLAESRTAWHRNHIDSEAARVLREYTVAPAQRSDAARLAGLPELAALGSLEDAKAAIVERAQQRYSISIEHDAVTSRPAQLRRSAKDPSSKYRVHGKTWYTSSAALQREDDLLAAGATVAGPYLGAREAELIAIANDLTPSQRELAVRFAGSGKLLDAGVGPAGAGKTTTMNAFVRGVEINRGRVVALAPSAAAADVLGTELDTPAETVAKFLAMHEYHGNAGLAAGRDDQRALSLDPNTYVLIDEAGMTSTRDIAAVTAIAAEAGASVRLLGDPHQLEAVEGGGFLALFDEVHGAGQLTDVHRFVDPDEALASLQLRRGERDVVAHYIERDRLHGGTRDEMLHRIYEAWRDDVARGDQAVMVATTNDDVRLLNGRAQADRIAAGDVTLTQATLADSHRVGIGDLIVTRKNDRDNRTADGSFVKNGDVWRVHAVTADGALDVRHDRSGSRTVLAAPYVRAEAELAYASTIHRVQGLTVAHAHVLVTPEMDRSALYVALSRGAVSNHAYVDVTNGIGDEHTPAPRSDAPAAVMRSVIGKDDRQLSARSLIAREFASAEALSTLLPHYEDAFTLWHSPVDHDYVRESLQEALGAGAKLVLEDQGGWHELARSIHYLEAVGADPVAELRAHVSLDALAAADQPASHVRAALGEVRPGFRTGRAEVDTYVAELEDVIRQRLADPHALDHMPGGRDLDSLRRAWGVTADDIAANTPRATPQPTSQGKSIRERAAALRAGAAGGDALKSAAAAAAGIGQQVANAADDVDKPRKKGPQL